MAKITFEGVLRGVGLLCYVPAGNLGNNLTLLYTFYTIPIILVIIREKVYLFIFLYFTIHENLYNQS